MGDFPYWSCARKQRFPTLEAAKIAARVITRRDRRRGRVARPGFVLVAYPCRACGAWHIGHEPSPPETKPDATDDRP